MLDRKRRQELGEVAQRVCTDEVFVRAARGNRVAAVLTTPDRDLAENRAAFVEVRRRRGARDSGARTQLRQVHAEVAEKARRPRAGRADDRVGAHATVFGDDAGDAACRHVERAHRAVFANRAAARLQRARERRHRLERLGAAVARE